MWLRTKYVRCKFLFFLTPPFLGKMMRAFFVGVFTEVKGRRMNAHVDGNTFPTKDSQQSSIELFKK